jgi:hypothetical protein
MVMLKEGTKEFVIMGGDEQTSQLVRSEWETLDFLEDMELASKINDEDIAAVLCIASAKYFLKHLKFPLLKEEVTGKGLVLLGNSTVLETISMDTMLSYNGTDTRFMKEEVLKIVDAIVSLEGNSFCRLHSPGPNCALEFIPLLRNRMGLMNVNSGCVYFGITFNDIDNVWLIDVIDKCYTCKEVHVISCTTCNKRA